MSVKVKHRTKPGKKSHFLIDDDIPIESHGDLDIDVYSNLEENKPIIEDVRLLSKGDSSSMFWKSIENASSDHGDSDGSDLDIPRDNLKTFKRPKIVNPPSIIKVKEEPKSPQSKLSPSHTAQNNKIRDKSPTKTMHEVWKRGLKQDAEKADRLKMAKESMEGPLTRQAGDASVDSYLKSQLHKDDPMFKFFSKAKRDPSKPETPKYKGHYAPNRFGIPPGYRWDGVDRSNGYEKRYFERQAKQTALKEMAYKWSTEDM